MEPKTICNEFGSLKDVIGHFIEGDGITNMLISLELIFENGRIFHEAIPETDEIAIKSMPPEDACIAVSVKDMEPWSFALEREVLWVWDLYNQGRYVDGRQYSFCNTVAEGEVIVQLMVVASQIVIYIVTESHNKRL
ncbi:DUF6334 family protein [Microbulbifer guangxiensis]|uniref:DUF6334 family protein n=1 Tax=Microbulbifer guangxiensis TaxID=2904249 RepID=UPI001F2C58A7|nr:DUF6334 family protein [Microbulbifer guangxiensis]